MAIYYKIVFGLLVTEISIFLGLMIPLPNHLKQKSLIFIRDRVVSKAQYTLKIIAVFVFILLIDSVNNLMTAMEKTEIPESQSNVRLANAINVKKFYAQRNAYLTGATLFISFILNYTFDLIIKLLSAKDNLNKLDEKSSNGNNSERLDDQTSEIKRLTKELSEFREMASDFDNLKSKTKQQESEYSKLQEEVKKLEAQA